MAKLSAADQAVRVMSKLDRTGWSKADQKAADTIGYRSQVTLQQRTGELARAAERIFQRESISKIKDINEAMARREVENLVSCGLSSSTVHGYARALSDAHQFLHGQSVDFGNMLPARSTDAPQTGRAYTTDQIREITSHQSAEFALMTEIAHAVGLRASELTTLRPALEYPARIAEERFSQLVEQRWMGREGIPYAVTGKGGLQREVHIPPELSQRLEAFRLDVPRDIHASRGDDGRSFEQHYDLPSGEKWSQDFSSKSNELFGWSNGAHGLRHSFCSGEGQRAPVKRSDLGSGSINHESGAGSLPAWRN
jgi:Site-specific recombinase XerD